MRVRTLFCSLLNLWHWEQCRVSARYSVNICWLKKGQGHSGYRERQWKAKVRKVWVQVWQGLRCRGTKGGKGLEHEANFLDSLDFILKHRRSHWRVLSGGTLELGWDIRAKLEAETQIRKLLAIWAGNDKILNNGIGSGVWLIQEMMSPGGDRSESDLEHITSTTNDTYWDMWCKR